MPLALEVSNGETAPLSEERDPFSYAVSVYQRVIDWKVKFKTRKAEGLILD